MSKKITLIVLGEPYSTFSEIIGKYFSKNKVKNKIILIGNVDLLKDQLKKLNLNFFLNEIANKNEAKIKKVNIININFKYKKVFAKISPKSKNYIENCFKKSLEILKSNSKKNYVLINGPVSKKSFLDKKFFGITEYLSNKTGSKKEVMLIYNDKLSVSPLTTHIPLKFVSKNINRKKIYNNVLKINEFYNKILNKKARFAILGLNPHCETTDKFSEEEKIITPAIKILKKRGLNIDGPFSADTFFLKNNFENYNVVIGMYHDQVLTPIKTIFNFDAINITIGLPFIRISPDHGPNSIMLGKKKSDPSSFKYAIKFINKLK
tara:strand:+ start:79 stop:1041 length:963 start_codon:yes stop_codon:yes gene_type:complete